ncbi:hypothetical protein INT45_000705 [Circinella minor]|uniref:Uncharacterized protein n=1 Tax=Circinella minor TaxID=1195481 RepID=A0A8H7VBU1_9FUNG|nr:hypothetical protein INT45_000705 [Circinella minor]
MPTVGEYNAAREQRNAERTVAVEQENAQHRVLKMEDRIGVLEAQKAGLAQQEAPWVVDQVGTAIPKGNNEANSDAINKKRTVSASDSVMNRKMGHRVDVKYATCDAEIGCIEIGKRHDQTKEMKGGLVKMTLIMHDILINWQQLKRHFKKCMFLDML